MSGVGSVLFVMLHVVQEHTINSIHNFCFACFCTVKCGSWSPVFRFLQVTPSHRLFPQIIKRIVEAYDQDPPDQQAVVTLLQDMQACGQPPADVMKDVQVS